MLAKIRRHALPERVEYEPHAFPSGELRRRDEVRIAGHENDDVRLAFQSHRRDVEADPHIDPLLPQGGREIVVGQLGDRAAMAEEILLRLWFQNPGSVSIRANLAQSKREIPPAAQDSEKPLPENRLSVFA